MYVLPLDREEGIEGGITEANDIEVDDFRLWKSSAFFDEKLRLMLYNIKNERDLNCEKEFICIIYKYKRRHFVWYSSFFFSQ